MRLLEFTGDKYYYHATFTKHIPSILKGGLRQFEPSNWAKADGKGGTDRYNDEAGIFAFSHPSDAISGTGNAGNKHMLGRFFAHFFIDRSINRKAVISFFHQ